MSASHFTLMLIALLATSALTEATLEERIVGGVQQSITNRRFQVAVLVNDYLCGGTLVRLNWVLTSAHCVEGNQQSNILVRAGSNQYYSGGQTRKAGSVIVHPNYDDKTMDYDLALLRVVSAFSTGPNVATLPIADSVPTQGTAATVSGYGVTATSGALAPALMSAVVKLVDCGMYPSGTITPRMFCAGAPGEDSCSGDAGGPLTYNGVLIGIASWGLNCANANYPAVYTSVPLFKGWINNIIQQQS